MSRFLEELAEAYSYPWEMGESALDSYQSLEALRDRAPNAGSLNCAAILLAEMGRALESEDESGEGTPYCRARVEGEELQLFHSRRSTWVSLPELDALRPSPPKGESAEVGRARAWWASVEDLKGPRAVVFQGNNGGYKLTEVATTLLAAGEHDLVERMAREELERGARFPGHWWGVLAGSLLDRGAPSAESQRAIAHGLLYMVSYSSRVPELMYRWVEAQEDDNERRAVVYYGLKAYCKRFHAQRPGAPKPRGLKSRFGEVLAEWIRPIWPGAQGFDEDQLIHLRSLLDELANRPLKAIRAEVDARLEEIRK